MRQFCALLLLAAWAAAVSHAAPAPAPSTAAASHGDHNIPDGCIKPPTCLKCQAMKADIETCSQPGVSQVIGICLCYFLFSLCCVRLRVCVTSGRVCRQTFRFDVGHRGWNHSEEYVWCEHSSAVIAHALAMK